MSFFSKMFRRTATTRDEEAEQRRFHREDQAALAYREEFINGPLPGTGTICERFNITRQGLINGWARTSFDIPPFMREGEFIGEEE